MNAFPIDISSLGRERGVDFYQYLKLQLDKYALDIDYKIQNKLTRDLVIKFSEQSNIIEDNNLLLAKYNDQLEKMVDEKINEIFELQMATIYALVKLSESRDGDTGAHIERTSGMCRLMAELLRKEKLYSHVIDDEYIENIYRASPLHDIGKVGIPDSILLKPGKLTEKEFEIMKSHVEIGYNTIKEVQQRFPQNKFLSMGMDIIKNHHEKWDGSGYPDGLKGYNIALAGRIMAIVDVYDALRSKRVYKGALTHKESCDIIRKGRGSHFDPFIADIFLENNKAIEELHNKFSD